MRILVLNGPNLNMLGKRSKSHYGIKTLSLINEQLVKNFPEIELEFFQSNIEGELISKVQEAHNKFKGLIINPGGFAHTSVALRDALELLDIPKIEVHLSNVAARESFRSIMLTASVCNGYISGFKEYSYIAGIQLLKSLIKKKG
ncbi:MAG: 3-dehydroquinate dehydratase [Ignavibacteriales bacterium]|nr:MAG: 3-dehydroquinate dehydratase [Ignavibacteriales bacterium]